VADGARRRQGSMAYPRGADSPTPPVLAPGRRDDHPDRAVETFGAGRGLAAETASCLQVRAHVVPLGSGHGC
jgi:hypothetical protein